MIFEKHLIHIWFFLTFFLSGCGTAQTVNEKNLDWNPSTLNKNGCPEIGGDYLYVVTRTSSGGHVTNLIPIYAGSIYSLWKTASINPSTGKHQSPQKQPDFQSYYLEAGSKKNELKSDNLSAFVRSIFHLEQKSDALIQGGFDETKIVTKIGTEMSGCSGGALILRNIQENGGPDFSPRNVSYGEIEIKKEADGSLKIVQRRRVRNISFNGFLTEARTELPELVRIYPAATR